MAITGNISKTILTFGLGAAVAFAQSSGAAQSPQVTPSPQAAPGSQATPSPQATDKKTDPHGQGAHSADHGMSTNKGAGLMVGKVDHDFMVKAAQSGMMEVEAARLAQEKATSTEVKEFARKLEQNHQKANDQLKQIASEKNVELPADMGKHAAMIEKVRNLSGDKFDKEFMKMQVKHHKKDVSTFQKHADKSMDSDVKAFASATLPTLQQHLQEAEQLQGSTRGRSAPAQSTTDSTTQRTTDSTTESTPERTTPERTRESTPERTRPAPSTDPNAPGSTARPQTTPPPTN
jgi:putative membrane protein